MSEAHAAAPSAAPVHCPQCGYNLAELPENRCPECGFGYDHASVRWFAADYGAAKLIHLRRAVWISVASSLCAAIAHNRSMAVASAGVFLAALVTTALIPWMINAREYVPLRVGAVVVLLGFLFAYPALARLVAIGLALLALLRGPSPPAELHYVEHSLPEPERAAVRRWRIAAWSLLLVAALVIASSWR